ncbi:TetR/AcrR family transcriptional regulator [Clostridium ganghwense]|uniref:TetR/AcrR family transcriptional regulator n=1 Tax=Clostridium ganghwense TaxID=312089 RepID=A0ABT4CPJ8_9CLOT|nr:TetR/AcrR family transcriptional regulator [Clostridium ganghwense]MCY6370982.1 TetR/AcrR family transcriptional regulator [Clostridium ganghwense]
MPKQTFLNLPIERQKEIIDISLKEFSDHNFETASMNKIITEIGVAKGSFYRYFENKKDLYLFLLEHALNKKIDYLEKNIDTTTTGDFFEIYKSTVFNYMKFDLTFPIISKFLRTAVESKYIEETQVLNSLHGKTFITNLVSKGQGEGQIKQSLDIDFVILCIMNLSEAMLNYINVKLGLSYKELLEIMEGEVTTSKTELQNIFAQLMEVLKTGLKPAEA